MSKDSATLPLAFADSIAKQIVEKLKPTSSIIEIAGSIRRRKLMCGDVEIVALPKSISSFSLALYNELNTTMKRDSRQIKFHFKGVPVDLFLPQSHDYYRQLAIRTGSAEYSHKMIATAWVKHGWVGTEHGLRRRKECVQDKSGTWFCPKIKPELPPVWMSEREFFEWLHIDYLKPEERI